MIWLWLWIWHNLLGPTAAALGVLIAMETVPVESYYSENKVNMIKRWLGDKLRSSELMLCITGLIGVERTCNCETVLHC